MKIRFIKEASGIPVGKEGDYPNNIAKPLIEMGIAEEIKSSPKKEVKMEIETKEDKQVSKRKTKAKK